MHSKTYVAIIDAGIARLTVIELPDTLDESDSIEKYLVEYLDFNLSNCEWQVITSIDLNIDL